MERPMNEINDKIPFPDVSVYSEIKVNPIWNPPKYS
jgi:hypothetical protein